MAVIQQELNCPLLADYTGTDVPVTIAFDEANSNLTPGLGEFQTFCYIVTQVAEPTALSHFVLGICPTIMEEDLVSVTVTINGEPQTVVIGENVEIFTPPDTDPTTECSGIKFDFGLDEAEDVMNVCFSLSTVHAVGPVEACIKGGQIPPGTGEFVCGPVCGEIETCERTVYQAINVCVPVRIFPQTLVGPIDVRCCGEATVSSEPCAMEGEPFCEFFVNQRLCATVPIRFTAIPEDLDPIVTCDEPNQTGCENCEPTPPNGI